MQEWFDLFVREKTYLKGLSVKTIAHYRDCWAAFSRYNGSLSEEGLKAWVMAMREAGVSAGGVNTFIRGMNSFLTWLYENQKTPTHLKIKQLKTEKRVLKTYTKEEIFKIVNFHGKRRWEKRLHALLFLMIDTGCRVDELLGLRREHINFDNLLITVMGKGGKERMLPISREARAELYRFLKSHEFELVFCTRDGLRLKYDNLRRDLMKLLDKLGIEKTEGAFHAFRRFFGKNFIRNGGNAFYLKQQFGHTSLTMTNRYIEDDVQGLQEAHMRIGMMTKLKR